MIFSPLAFAGEPQVVPGEYIVKYKADIGGGNVVYNKLQGKASLKNAFPAMGMYHVTLKQGMPEKETVEAIKADPDVLYIEPNFIFSINDTTTGNNSIQRIDGDDLSAQDYSSSAATGTYKQSATDPGVSESWKIEASAASVSKVIVAVIDSGLDKGNRVFRPYQSGGTGALWVNQLEAAHPTDGIDNDGNGYVDDVNGWNFVSNTNNYFDDNDHGTHVSGIVVGAGLDIFAATLEESKILVMPIKFLDSTGKGSTSAAVKAIYYAVANGAQVINNSWGGSSYSRSLHEALTYAYNHHVMIASAAGNAHSNNDNVDMYPSNYDVPSNISVASTSSSDTLSSFSNYGPRTVHVGSPGENIRSTLPSLTQGQQTNYYGDMSGTSMATPFVAGMAALALREAPSLTGYQLKDLIMSRSQAVAGLAGRVLTEARIESLGLIQGAQSSTNVASSQPNYSLDSSSNREPASDAGAAGGCGLVSTAVLKGPGKGGGSNPMAGVLVGLMCLPMVVWFALRKRAPEGRDKRRYDRFKINSEVRVKVGDRELVGSMNSLSLGGLSFNADEALEKGGIVTLKIASPDGHEMIEVQGQVVWNENNQAYGVAFENARQGTLAMIQQWTQGLMKT
jgi:subtilisin family serine protease